MSWARLDDDFLHHPKVADAGPVATALHMRAIVYCCKYKTDGLITRRQLPRILDWTEDEDDFAGRPPDNRDLARRLVNAGLWDEHPEGGWVIHDFLDYNPSREAQRKKRDERAAAGRNGGLARAANRRAASSKPLATALAKPIAKPLATAIATARPELEAPGGSGDRDAPRPDHETVSRVVDLSPRNSVHGPSKILATATATAIANGLAKSYPVPVPLYAHIRECIKLAVQSCEVELPPSASPSSAEVVKIPTCKGEYAVTTGELAEWVEAYPGVDIRRELRSMRQWCLSNPKRRKTDRGIRRFITGWLSRTQNSGRPQDVTGSTFADATREAMEWAHAEDEQDRVHRRDE